MASAVDSRLAYARLSAVATATEFPWRWIGSTTPANLDVIWGMSA